MNTLSIIEQRLLFPTRSVDCKEISNTWERLWCSQHRYINPALRLKRAINKLDILERMGVIFEKRKVLDVGCGDGTTLNYLNRRRGSYGYGIDIAPTAIDLAKMNTDTDNLNFQLGDGRQLQFARETFDLVLSWGVMEHANDFLRFLGEAYRVLRSDGSLLLIQPHLLSAGALQRRWLQLTGQWRFGPQREFSWWQLSKYLVQHGFPNVSHRVEPAPEEFSVVHTIDNIIHRFSPAWGHYLFIIARK